jgi:hypothetical protein
MPSPPEVPPTKRALSPTPPLLGQAARDESTGWRGLAARAAKLAEHPRASYAGAAVTLLFIAVIFWMLARHLTYTYVNDDERCFVWTGWAINRGMVPYRDFWDFKPPAVFLANAVALRLFGLEQQGYRYFFTGFAGFAVLALAASLLRRNVERLAVVAVGLAICWLWLDTSYHDSSFDDAESIGMSCYLLGVACWLVRERALQPFTDFLGGVLLTMAVLSKEPYAFAVVPSWAAFVALHFAEKSYAPRRFAIFSLGGVALVAVCLFGYFAAHGALGDYLTTVYRYGTMGETRCIAAGRWEPGPPDWERQVKLATLANNLVDLQHLGPLGPLLLAPLLVSRGRQIVVTAAAVIALFGGLYAVTLGGCFYDHYYIMGMSGLLFMMVIGALLLSPHIAALPIGTRVGAGLMIALFPAWALYPRLDESRQTEFIVNPPPEPPALVQFIQENSGPNDTIFTSGLPSLYTQSNRRHAVREGVFVDYFLDLYPGATDRERAAPFYRELVANRPKIVVIEPKRAETRQRYAAALWMPFIEEYGYRKVEEGIYLRPD